MTSAPPLPRSIEGWIKHLDPVRLPIAREQHLRISRALADSRLSLRDIALQMQDCPAIALSLLREANRPRSPLHSPAESLEVALTRLGIGRCEQLLGQLPQAESSRIPPPLRQLELISLHAMQQANGLFAHRLARLWQEVHWGSLLFLAPLWPLLAAHPTLFLAWEQRVLAAGEPARQVEQELLGVPLLQLCQALVEHWRLPQWIIDGYRLLNSDKRLLVKALHIARDQAHPLQQQHQLDADPALRRWLGQPAHSLLLANGLAVAAHHSWSTPHSLRWQRLAGLYLQQPLELLQQQVHQHAVSSARLHAQADLWHPAEALLWPWDCQRLHVARKDSHAQATAPASSRLHEDWKPLCTELLKQPSPFDNLLQLTSHACRALRACGLQRILLLLADRQHTRLVAQQSSGLSGLKSGFSLDPASSQILKRLLQKPAQLRLEPANQAQYSALLPGNLKALFPSEHLLLRSLASQERVVMLLVCDQQGMPFSSEQLHAFGKTVQCIERALDNFSRRAR